MDQLKNMLKTATVDKAVADAQLRIIEGVLADFFRLTLDPETFEELRDGVEQLSRKLLSMQQLALQDRDTAARVLNDLQTGLMQQAMAQVQQTGDEAQRAVDEGAPAPPIESAAALLGIEQPEE